MDLLSRLRYILVVACPPLPVCELIIQILIRIARHCAQSAEKVLGCPFLMENIFKKFLPTSWNMTSIDAKTKKTVDFVHPVPCAVKLVTVIAASSCKLASHLVENHPFQASLSCYLSIGLSEGKLSVVAMQKLLIESLKCWTVFLQYGLCSDIYIDLFPILMRQLQYFITVSISAVQDIHAADYMYASVFLKALEAVVVIAANQKASASSRPISSMPLPSIMWNHVTGMFPLVESCLQKWLSEFSHCSVTTAGSVLLASCIDLYCVHCTKARDQSDFVSAEFLNKLQEIIIGYLLPCLQSPNFSSLLDNLRHYSVFLFKGFSGTKRDTSTLTSLGSILWMDDIVPILKEGTPFPITTSILRLLTVLIRILPNALEKITKILLLHPSVVKYTKQLIAKSTFFTHWFDRFEVAFLYHLVELSTFGACGDLIKWPELCLSVLPYIRTTDEWIIKCFLENIFEGTSMLYSEIRSSDLVNEREKMLVETVGKQDSVFQNVVSKDKLQEIGEDYVKWFLEESSLNKSRQKWLRTSYNEWATSIEADTKSIVPSNWPYKPLEVLYHLSKNCDIISPDLIAKITSFLEWISLLMDLHHPSFKHIPPADVFCHLSAVFLLGSDFFYNDKIRKHLHFCLSQLVTETLDLEKVNWNNATGYDDLFLELVMQFEAESYGDCVFANYLLVAFQQCYPSRWKTLIFAEHPQAVRIIGVSISETIVPLVNYLEPKEKDVNLLSVYFKVLSTGLLIPERNPLLYLMAVHHLHHYLFLNAKESEKFQKILINSLMRCKKKEIVQHVILFKNANENQHLGFDMVEHLTPETEQHLKHLYGKNVEFFIEKL